MKILAQRVTDASVRVGDRTVGSIARGLVIYLGVHVDDTEKDAEFLANKVVNLRVFEDSEGKMNLSALQLKLELLVISQFTLYADTEKGYRPSFTTAMKPEGSRALYEKFIEICRRSGLKVETGEFRADMRIASTNDGPVSIIIESR